MTLTLVNWNVERATPRSPKWKRDEILGRIESHNPDVICLTETDVGLLSKNGCAIYPQIDQASEKMGKRNQRKVLLWSRELWEQVDLIGNDSLRPGRFVAGVTHTSVGDAMVVGVCIPWRNSPGVKGSGVKVWEHHKQYLDVLQAVLKGAHNRMSSKPLIVMGDFNQRFGRSYPFGPTPEVRKALLKAFPSSMSIVTMELELQGERGVNHIALSDDLTANAFSTISNITEDGKRLSDHFGIAATVGVQD